MVVILLLARRMQDDAAEAGGQARPGRHGALGLGLALVVFGVLRSGSWGFVQPKSGAPRAGWGSRP